jgi:hypothetical protein
MRDVERMLFCDVCGAQACFGFGVTLDGLRMGDVGTWRCTDHHPDLDRQLHYTREEWAETRRQGLLYPTAAIRAALAASPAKSPAPENV